MLRKFVFFLLTLSFSLPLIAQQDQHEHGSMLMPQMPAPEAQPHDHGSMQQMDMGTPNAVLKPEFSPGSGTAWAPQDSPEYMWMGQLRSWTWMAHGSAIIGLNNQGGPRGTTKLQSQNWLMLMEQRQLGRGTLQLREMFSAEPLTAPHPGFPLLFQTGETYHGRPLVDHQHPHDVFMEISARYVFKLTDSADLSIYAAPAGEPALGPVAFMHRPSAYEMPDAPISHHVQDSTHITYGVLTTGVAFHRFKIEGSIFNGREPDERRYDFDFGALDSAAGRVQFAPNRNWTMQYSYGHLRHPEALEPGNINRQTASVMYNRALARGNWATSLVWGRNLKSVDHHVQNSYLVESSLNFAERNYAYTRLELVDKDELFPQGGSPTDRESFRIGAYSFGGVRDLVQSDRGLFGLGAQVTFYTKPNVLNPIYGRNPVSFEIFIRLRPPKMMM